MIDGGNMIIVFVGGNDDGTLRWLFFHTLGGLIKERSIRVESILLWGLFWSELDDVSHEICTNTLEESSISRPTEEPDETVMDDPKS